MIPYGRQEIDLVDIEAVVQVLCSDFLTQALFKCRGRRCPLRLEKLNDE